MEDIGDETRLFQGDNKEIDGKDHSATNPEFELIENEEKSLATSLRSLCTPSGEEVRKTLEESADILLKLGQVYLQRAILETGIEQKMTYIRCAVLLHAAIERFKITNNTEKIQQAKLICNKMGDNLLNSCGSCIQVPLLGISEKIFELVCKKRIEIQGILDTDLCRGGENDPDFSAKMNVPEKLKILENMDGLSCVDLEKIFSPDKEEKEWKITEKVREINEDVTAFYKGMMCKITTDCLNLLLPPPCKFAIVGLGSMAREEVTLYSDFEHIILLEEGIDDKENYESILEYFRWFSVVFQVVVIGFGETIIPSVAVKSLNDSYSGNAELNWFYDNYTQNGISFDGMLPHACKIPIGKQQPTKNRPHTVELIKTPQKMANYLTQKEQLKNGYHLADVLRQTCLVCGDNEIYTKFMKERSHILGKDKTEIHEIYSEMILKNTTPEVRLKNTLFTGERMFDSKPVFYRPFATFLGVIARIHKVEGKSSFEIIDRLHDQAVVGPFTYKKLKYAFASACEIRMKLYHAMNQQRHSTQVVDINAMVGKPTLWSSQKMMNYLKYMTFRLVTKGDMESLSHVEIFLTAPDTPYVIMDLEELGYIDQAIKLGEKLCQRRNYEDTRFNLSLFDCYERAIFLGSQQTPLQETFEKAEALYLKLQQQNLSSDVMSLDESMAQIYFRMGLYEKVISVNEDFFPKYLQAAEKGYDNAYFIPECYRYYIALRNISLSPEQIDERLKTVLWDKTDNVECQLMKRWHLAGRSYDAGETGEDIAKAFASISTDVQKLVKKLVKPDTLYSWVSQAQLQMWCLEDAAKTLKSASQYQKARSNREILRENAVHTIESLKLMCLCRLHGNIVAKLVVTKNSRIALNDKQRNEALLQHLIKIIWRGINLSWRTVGSITVLSWVIHMKIQGRMSSVFLIHQQMKDPKKKFTKVVGFAKKYQEVFSKHTHISRDEMLLGMLLLAKSL